MAVSAFDTGGVAWAMGKDVSVAISGASVIGWTGAEVPARSMSGKGFGVGALVSGALAFVAFAVLVG